MIGTRLKVVRKNKSLTQQKLAELIGVSKTTISGWENDLNCPSVETLIKVCKSLEVSADYLLGFDTADGIDVTGLPDEVIYHIQELVNYLREKKERG